MPVAAIGGVAMAAGMAATATTAATTAFAVIGAVGAVASTVGQIAGIKELSIAGSAMSAVGGVGSIASGAGLFGSAGGLTSEGAAAGGTMVSDSAASVGAAPAAAGESSAGSFANIGDLINGKGLDTDVLSTISGTNPPENVLPTAASLTSPSVQTNQFGQPISQGGGEGGSLGTVENPAAPSGLVNQGTSGDTVTTPASDSVTSGPYQAAVSPSTGIANVTVKPGETQPETPAPLMPKESESIWGGISKWIEKHPSLAMMGVSAVGSFLSGAFDPKKEAERSALEAQAARSEAETGLINQRRDLLAYQMSNMQQPIPQATRTRTNTGTGLINRGAA